MLFIYTILGLADTPLSKEVSSVPNFLMLEFTIYINVLDFGLIPLFLKVDNFL